jgi:methionyl-tRNA formyltransferase
MNVVFFGTPEFALPTLSALIASPRHHVAGVVTQPDRPKGRGRKLAAPPVKILAREANLPLLQTADANEPETVAWIRQREPRVGVVVAFGQFLKRKLREAPELGFINLHASLLPKYRGAAPIHTAIRAGDTLTGVSVMKVERRLDAGPVFACLEVEIGPDENVGELAVRLAEAGAPLILDVLDRLEEGTAVAEPQDEAAATHAGLITAEQRVVDWNRPAGEIHNHVRGLTPHPGAMTRFEPSGSEGFAVRITRTRVAEPGQFGGPPGSVVGREGDGVRVQAGGGATLIVLKLVPAGSREMTAADFLSGRGRGGGRFA